MPRVYKKKAAAPPLVSGGRVDRYLACSVCDLAVTLSLGPQHDRPQHRCKVLYKAMPFDIDLPADEAPGRRWYEDKPKSPRPPSADDGRPEIVL